MDYQTIKKETESLLAMLADRQEHSPADKYMLDVLKNTIKEIETCEGIIARPSNALFERNTIVRLQKLPLSPKVGCQGVEGAYSNIAANKMFAEPKITFYENFSDVTQAVSTGEVEFGVLPLENSTAGAVEDVIEYIRRDNCYISMMDKVEINHCLCGVKGGTLGQIKEVYSHPQALKQASNFIKANGYKDVKASNTAVAAKLVAQKGDVSLGCICSRLSAEIYGLEIIKEGVQNFNTNYTRFIVISSEPVVLEGANRVALSLSFPNRPGELNKLLTKFSVFNLDLTKIQSLPIGGTDFHVRFHLDFKGNIGDWGVGNLLGHMYEEYSDFRFLGNYLSV